MRTPNEPKWLTLAAREIGTKEIMGLRHNPRIVQYHQTTELRATEDEVAWCSAFVNWVFTQFGVKGTNSPLARSWLKWGTELKEPYKGCIVIFKRGNSSWQGHVGFFIKKDGSKIACLGGNQSNQVKISYYAEASVLGYREPEQSDLLIIDQTPIPEPLGANKQPYADEENEAIPTDVVARGDEHT